MRGQMPLCGFAHSVQKVLQRHLLDERVVLGLKLLQRKSFIWRLMGSRREVRSTRSGIGKHVTLQSRDLLTDLE